MPSPDPIVPLLPRVSSKSLAAEGPVDGFCPPLLLLDVDEDVEVMLDARAFKSALSCCCCCSNEEAEEEDEADVPVANAGSVVLEVCPLPPLLPLGRWDNLGI